MELPAYHAPSAKNVLHSVWERGSSFVKRAGTVILLSSIIIWFTKSYGWAPAADVQAAARDEYASTVAEYEETLADYNARSEAGTLEEDEEEPEEPALAAEMEEDREPGSWGAVENMDYSILGKIGTPVSTIFKPLGFGNMPSTVATVMGLVAKEEVVGVFGVLDFEGMSQIAGYAFLAFNLLCAPCFAAMGAIKREMNNAKWTAFAIGYQCGFAYLVSLCIYQIGALFSSDVQVNVLGLIIAIAVVVLAIFMIFKPYKESTTLSSNKVKA